jgi:Quinohemoprotein amine dehydrogenase, gamma subunit
LKHLKGLNRKARRIDGIVSSMEAAALVAATAPAADAALDEDIVALQNQTQQRPHIPMGCALAFSPGWEVDSAGGTAGLCQPVERDIYDCYVTCFWPAQVPDHLNNYPDWASKCATATKDWRILDLVFP